MSELADLLEPRLEDLIQRWVDQIARSLAPKGLSRPALRDHIKDVLGELVESLRRGAVPDEMERARKHGKQRYDVGFQLGAVTREHGVLRRLILDLCEQEGLGLSTRDNRLLSDFFAVAIEKAVDEYERQRALSEEKLAGAVREREGRLSAVLDSTLEGLCGVDPEGLCMFANPAAASLLGFHTPGEMLGHDLLGAPHSRRGEGGERGIAEDLQRVLTTGQDVRGEDVRLARLDGSSFPARYSISPLRGDAQVSGAVIAFEDITARRRGEQELARARLMNDTALTVGEVGTFTWDIVEDRLYGNASLSELFGLELDASGAAPLADYVAVIHPDDRDATVARIQRTVDEGTPYEAEYRLVTPRGLRWVVARGGLQRDASGRPVRFPGVVMDITDRKQAEAALHTVEDRYRTLFESLDDGFCLFEVIFDGQGKPVDCRLLQANAAFETQMGVPVVVGKTMRELAPDHEPFWFDLYGRVVTTGEPARFEARVGAVDRWFSVYAVRLGPAAQRQVVVVFSDISERKRGEQERELLVEELTRSNTALDQFAHIASHDLRAPLRGIGNLATWIEDDLGEAVTDDARHKLGLMRGRVKHLEAMITSILDFATAGRSKSAPEPVEPRPLLAEIVALLDPPANLTIELGDAMPALVVDRAALQQVLMNLLGNAIKHTQKPGATIRVEAREEGECVHFSVADNGQGIAPKDQESIWGLFQRLAGRSQAEGTGIGLALVKKTVESRGGRVWVESELGQGATFHVLWPRRPQHRHEPALAPRA